MEEELINFKTAKLAKEKGFDIICKHGYIKFKNKKEKLQYNWDFSDCETKKEYINSLNGFLDADNYGVPTQSLLQKWLRDEHNITLLVDFSKHPNDAENPFKCLSVETTREDFDRKTLVASYFHKSYEKALEKGLQKALKLIK